jgi:hypothetical protein
VNYRASLIVCSFFLVAGCAQLDSPPDPSGYAARMTMLGERYVQCVSAEADNIAGTAAGAEDIAVAAHGRCWSAWRAYQDATKTSFSYGAQTPAEVQLANDKADAHLRQFERETRRAAVDKLVSRAMHGEKPRQ